MKRPIAVAALSLILGILVCEWIPLLLWGTFAVLLICLAFCLIYRRLKGYSPFLLLALPFMLAGFLLHLIQTETFNSKFERYDGQAVTVEGYILDEPSFSEGRTVFTLDAVSVRQGNEAAVSLRQARIKVSVYSDVKITDLTYGSRIAINGTIKMPQGQRNIGGFDYRKFLEARGISATCGINPSQIERFDGSRTFFLKSAGYAVRKGILDSLYGSMPDKEASVVAGMLIGYTQDMPENMTESFRRAGLSHVMAVSGANIAFLLFPLLWLLHKAGLNRKWSSAVSLPILLFYVFATGMEASVVRAAIMAGITLIGMIFWRQTDFFCSVAASAIVILLTNTFMLFDAGFILSYAAVLSLVVFYKPVYDRLPKKLPKFGRDALAGSFSAQLGVVPVIAGTFNTFSVVSLFANLLIVPLTGILTAAAAVLSIFWFVFRPLCAVLGNLVSFITDFILAATEGISSIPWAEINIAAPGLLLVAGYYVFLLVVRYGLPHLRKGMAGTVVAAMLAIYGSMVLLSLMPPGCLEIYFADVGQGDCSVIITPSGRSILIDGGGSLNDEESSYTGEMIVVPVLYDLKITKIDVMVATHGHADHVSGLKSVIDKIPVKRLVVADAEDSEMKNLIDYATVKGIRIERANQNDILYSEEDLRLTALYPLEIKNLMPAGQTADANELSLVSRLDYGGFSALFTGDIGIQTENIIPKQEYTGCDLLKVAHHGSKYSSGKSFIDAVNPKAAVISVGTNKYGHPAPELEERLTGEGIKLYETIIDGGIMIKVDKNKPEVMAVTTVIHE